MIDNPSCAICGSSKWYKLTNQTFDKKDLTRYSDYERKRLIILFDKWFAGEKTVELVYRICNTCGFVYYAPRPDYEDVNAKYLQLLQQGSDCGLGKNEKILSRRRQRIYRAVKDLLPVGERKVLDYGGGDGGLVAPLYKDGHSCYLVDYNDKPQKYVEKLGDTVEDLGDGHVFDLIICSHVVEHVAEPVGLIKKLSRHLEPKGHMFIEVPMEIWRKAPIHAEPVTHINFFVKGSLKRCLEEAGLLCIASRLAPYLNNNGHILMAVQAIGMLGDHVSSGSSSSGRREVYAYLSPGLIDRVRKAFVLREKLPEMVRYKLGLRRSQNT